jgi:predicted RNA binding protein YcfA (HicA-like mRNA interferase family)
MATLPVISGRDAVKAFEKLGFVFHRPKGKPHYPLPSKRSPSIGADHRELDRGTLRALIRGAGVTVEEFVTLI